MKIGILTFLVIVLFCAACEEDEEDGEGEELHGNRRKMIFPFTKWCGAGDNAKNYDDLGMHETTDKCCRAHDNCFDYIVAGDTKHGLHNDGFITKSHCDCDYEFLECLQEVNTITSGAIGIIYFNKLAQPCFKEAHPATCVKHEGFFRFARKCVEYEYDSEKPKIWQWFDVSRWIRSLI